MEETVNSTNSSNSEGIHGDMSYIYGRDPSILAFGQRPLPSSKQNLISLYEDEEVEYSDETTSLTSVSLNLQTVKVYLRMKPFPRKLKLSKEETEAYKITSPTTLVTKLPALDNTFASIKGQKSTHSVGRKFTFTQTFGPETTQFQLFEEAIQQKIADFLSGLNCTVMTYGTTNSGKSYTLQGTTTSPGIIPRSLEYVFSNINPRPTPCYKPIHSSKVVCLNAIERAQELEAKNKLLTFGSLDKHQYINAYKHMQKLLQEESPIRSSEAYDAHYSVWVSFAEIYNENIYDLLSNDCQKRRPLLKLAADSNNRAFIKGLKTVCVNSGSEAYQVLMAGQYNLKVAATALNARSSRSHCIFTIQLLKYFIENTPDSVQVSTFTFCDLAGSERLKKTLNVGDRLKEAQNINTSLLVLGRCLKSIYEGQSTKQRQEHVGPFRESKLTRLFQRALSGKEQITLIVNVNPVPNLYVETQNVLNFSAIAKKIILEPKKIHRKVSNTRFSQIVAQSVKSTTDWDPTDLSDVVESVNGTENDSSIFINPEDYEDLLEENDALKKELNALKASTLERDLEIRQELTETYTSMIKKLENEWTNRIKDVEAQSEDNFEWRINLVENFYKEKINELTSRKRRRTTDSGSENEDRDFGELEMENSRLQAKIHSLKKNLKHLRESNETLLKEKNKFAFENGLFNEELKSVKGLLSEAQSALCNDDATLAYVEALKKQLNDKQELIKKLKEFLNEAKEEYISITDHAKMMEERLKDREEALAEVTENLADLKDILENTNTCLAEKTKMTDFLEEKLSQQQQSMLEAEERHCMFQKESEETIQQLRKEIENLKNSSSQDGSLECRVPTVTVKQEVFSETDPDTSTESPQTDLLEKIFIKTDDDEIMGIPSTIYDKENRESEMYVKLQEIEQKEQEKSLNRDFEELDARLHEANLRAEKTEEENLLLRTKLSQSLAEIQSLHDSLRVAKEELDDVTRKIDDLKSAQNIETKNCDQSLSKKSLEKISLKDSESQTLMNESNESSTQTDQTEELNKSMQTSFVEASEEDTSVQTSNQSNEELLVLKHKLFELEVDCKDKSEAVIKLEQEIEQLQNTNNTLDRKSQEDREEVEKSRAKVDEIRKKLDLVTSEVKTKQQLIADLEDKLSGAEERENTQSKSIEEYREKIEELERLFTTKGKEQEQKIAELNESIERLETENKELERRVQSHTKETEELRVRLEQAESRDKEKDQEIKTLQKSYKNHLTADINNKKIHEELSAKIKELAETKEALSRTDELYQRLRLSSKKDIQSLEKENSMLESKSDKLRIEKDELKIILAEKERELESFTANREMMIVKYDTLVKSLQEEVERGKKEIARYEDLCNKIPITPRGKTQKNEDRDHKDQISLVELSDSENKKPRRRVILAPSSTEVKRSTRKKKLYCNIDDTCVDVEATETPLPSPSPSNSTCTRSLRNRRK